MKRLRINTPAAECAFKINYAVERIIQPEMNRHYPGNEFLDLGLEDVLL